MDSERNSLLKSSPVNIAVKDIANLLTRSTLIYITPGVNRKGGYIKYLANLFIKVAPRNNIKRQ